MRNALKEVNKTFGEILKECADVNKNSFPLTQRQILNCCHAINLIVFILDDIRHQDQRERSNNYFQMERKFRY